jgi:hypothetical protein
MSLNMNHPGESNLDSSGIDPFRFCEILFEGLLHHI